jgi:competence protein ComEA
MRSRRTPHDEMAAIARRRLEQLSAELAGLRESTEEEPERSPSRNGFRSDDQPADPSTAGAPFGQVAVRAARPDVASSSPVLATRPQPASAPSLTGPMPVQSLPALTVVETASEEIGGSASHEVEAWVSPVRGRHARRPVGAGDRVGGWVHDRLPPTLQGRVSLTASHLSVVALLVAAAFAVSAWWVVRADASGTVVPAATWTEGTESPAVEQLVTPAVDPAGGDPDNTTVADTEPAVVVVDVAGKVRRPGIVSLPLGSRVHDALDAAGGARKGVDLTGLNLARVLVDGEQILVGVAPAGGVAAPAASAPGAEGAGGPMVNVNTGGQSELEELPGIGPVTAASILQWRADNGPFTSVDELLEVSGIGEATLAKIAPFVTL